mmetsp:Transcript_2872/g.4915  ORF Transcript_2872/g.4915 Transcript_2872/m.4915 type:complete len:338 (+) Transcript_2872:106-1119(+)
MSRCRLLLAAAVSLIVYVPHQPCWSSPSSLAEVDRCSRRLTIVLVTSPIPSHPATELVDQVIESFDLVRGLERCPLVIVADGFQVRDGRPAWNQGKIDESTSHKYLAYIDALTAKYCKQPIEDGEKLSSAGRHVKIIGPLQNRVNFGHALLAGLSEVDTEFVLVVQHDRVFAEQLDMSKVLDFFDTYSDLRYVGFQTVPDYETYAVSKYGGWARCKDSDEPGLIPCFMWYDSTHVCKAESLASLIEKEVKPGEFIESSYGCRLLAEIQQKNEDWSFKYHLKHYGVFLYLEPAVGTSGPLVRHVSGRSFVSREQRIKMGWPAERPYVARRSKEGGNVI